jgi:hypothetical protein
VEAFNNISYSHIYQINSNDIDMLFYIDRLNIDVIIKEKIYNTTNLQKLLRNEMIIEEFILLHGSDCPTITKKLIDLYREKQNFSFLTDIQKRKNVNMDFITNKDIKTFDCTIFATETHYNYKFKKFTMKSFIINKKFDRKSLNDV